MPNNSPPRRTFTAWERFSTNFYKSRGCFGGETFELLFKNGTSFSATLWYFRGPSEATKVLARSVSLSEGDLRGLDELLLFYRSNPGGWCTVVDEIKITHLRENEVSATERFTDRSCRSREVEGVLTFSTLASKKWILHRGPRRTPNRLMTRSRRLASLYSPSRCFCGDLQSGSATV
jgi:hypothetical protein